MDRKATPKGSNRKKKKTQDTKWAVWWADSPAKHNLASPRCNLRTQSNTNDTSCSRSIAPIKFDLYVMFIFFPLLLKYNFKRRIPTAVHFKDRLIRIPSPNLLW